MPRIRGPPIFLPSKRRLDEGTGDERMAFLLKERPTCEAIVRALHHDVLSSRRSAFPAMTALWLLHSMYGGGVGSGVGGGGGDPAETSCLARVMDELDWTPREYEYDISRRTVGTMPLAVFHDATSRELALVVRCAAELPDESVGPVPRTVLRRMQDWVVPCLHDHPACATAFRRVYVGVHDLWARTSTPPAGQSVSDVLDDLWSDMWYATNWRFACQGAEVLRQPGGWVLSRRYAGHPPSRAGAELQWLIRDMKRRGWTRAPVLRFIDWFIDACNGLAVTFPDADTARLDAQWYAFGRGI